MLAERLQARPLAQWLGPVFGAHPFACTWLAIARAHSSGSDARGRGGQPGRAPAATSRAQASITERYIHAAQVRFPGAAQRAEDRLFGGIAGLPGPKF